VTSALLSRDEIVTALVAQGANRRAAERAADLELSRRGQPGLPPLRLMCNDGGAFDFDGTRPDLVAVARQIGWPLELTLPWSHLVSDNQRHGAIVRLVGPNHTPTPLLIMTAAYREAKGKIMKLARAQLAGAEPVAIPLKLEARVWLPGGRGKHDVCNFAKAVHDALQEIVYVDDQYLHDVRWIRAGVDVDHPRAELTISPLTP
jgi:Holliday junction resolvase RusA-like endonuclease